MYKKHLLFVLPIVSAFLALFLGYPLVAQAATVIYVDAEAIGLGNGSSWEDAYTDLQTALSVATSGDEIWVAEGVYYPDEGVGGIDDALISTFVLIDDVPIYGGFDPGSDVDEMAERDWETYVTVLSGDIDHETNPDVTDPHGVVTDTANIAGNNAYHVVSSDNVTGTAYVDGFFITAGQANGSSPDDQGGGMYNVASGSPTLANVTFSGNMAGYGGGMYNIQNAPTLTNVTFSGNAAFHDGGGMYNDQSDPVLTGVTFSGNLANKMGGEGGGMYNTQSDFMLADVVFSNNQARRLGGGMVNKSSSSTLMHVTFSDNQAGESGWMGDGGGMYNLDSNSILTDVIFSGNETFLGGDGGGIDNWASDLTLTTVVFSDNSAEYGGGISNHAGDHNLTLINVTFSGNSATKGGGGMSNQSNATLTNVTFSNNTAQGGDGGGMANASKVTTLTNVAFSGNSASDRGGGMYHYNASYANVITLTNSTFSGNTANLGGGMATSSNGLPTLINATFTGNSADEGGGGMYNYFFSNPGLTNAVFSGNTADDNGGGIYNQRSSSPQLTNVTLSGNTATNNGSGIFNDYLSNPTLINTILWGNTANSGNQIDNENSNPRIGYSDVQGCGGSSGWDTSCGIDTGNNIDSDPRFVRDPNPGPDGNWDGVKDDYGDLHLRGGSPARDTGTNAGCPATDLDWAPRPFNGVCDMGAYEYGASLPDSTIDINYDSGAPGSFFTLSGNGFPPNGMAVISVNGAVLGTMPTDGSGSFSFLLSTTNADEGTYFVRASVNPSATVQFILSSDKPTRPQEGSGTVFELPAGVAYTESIFLPMVMRK
jgi:parallel beta-helix repeat protein